MPPATAHELLDELGKAQLLAPDQLAAAGAVAARSRSAQEFADQLVRNKLLTTFQADQAVQGYAEDLVIGPYHLLEVRGEGGMGTVFKARDTRLNRDVALKMIRPDLLQNREDIERRFKREAQAVAQIMHPNVVVIYDFGEARGVHYLAMEYVEGVDLAKMVQQQGVLPVQVACEYVKQAAQGLAAAHDRGVIHRDIKPSNLFVTRPAGPAARAGTRRPGPADTPAPGRGGAGVVKILDMGLARLAESSEQSVLTQAGSVIGTPDFIAPEQATDASKVDSRADLYSLGCTFYYLLTGIPPYPEGTPVQKLQKHVNEKVSPKPAEQIRPGLPPEVARVLYRLMAKKPNSRYQSAHEVVDDLQDVQYRVFSGLAAASDSAATAGPAAAPAARTVTGTTPPPTAAFGVDTVILPARRSAALAGHKGYVTALAFSPDGRLLASGGVDEAVRLWDLGPMLTRAGARPAEQAALRGQLDVVQAIAFDPTGTYLVTGSASAMKGPMWRWYWREADPAAGRLRVPGEPVQVDALAFSRDGLRFAGSAREAVFVWALGKKGLARETILRGHTTSSRAVAFHPDGKRLALGGEDTTVRLYEFGWLRNTLKPPLKGHTDAVTSLAYSAAGNLLATGSKDGTIRLWDGTGADPAPRAVLAGHKGGVRLVRFTPKGDSLVSVADGGQVLLWDLGAQAQVREWAIDKAVAHSLALSPDARYLAVGTAGGGEGLVSLYDLELIMVEQLAPTAAGM